MTGHEERYIQCYWNGSTADWLLMEWYYQKEEAILQVYMVSKDLVPSLAKLQETFEEAVRAWNENKYLLSDQGGGMHIRYFVPNMDDLPF